MDPLALELQQESDDNSEAIPDVVQQPVQAPPKKERWKVQAPSTGAPVSSAESDKELDAVFKDLGLDPAAGPSDKEQQIIAPAEAQGFWSTVGDTVLAVPELVKGVAQFGQNVSNVSKEAFETVWNKYSKDKIDLEDRRKFAAPETTAGGVFRKVGELGTPAMIGGMIGAVGGPIGVAAGGMIGGMVGAFIQDPDDANLSTAVQGTKYENLPVLAPIFDRLAHKPGDSDIDKRYKNMVEDGLMGSVISGGIFVATRGIKRVASAAKSVVDDVKNYRVSKMGVVEQAKEMPPALQQIDDEVTLAAKEQQYSKASADDAVAVMSEVNKTGEATIPKSKIEVIADFEEGTILKQDAANLDTYIKRNQEMTSKKSVVVDMDDADVAAIKYDEGAQKEFVKAVDEAMPSATPDKVSSVTLRNDEVVEALEPRAQKAQGYYASQRAAGEPVEYEKVMEEAAKRNQTPGELNRILTDPKYVDPEYNMSAVEASQVRMFYMDSLNDFEQLTGKVMSGLANDAELAAYAIAKENVGKLGNIMDGAGTGTAHALGIRGLLKKYAQAGNPVAIELIGLEGQAKAIRAVIESVGGKKALQDEAKLFAEFIEQAQRPSGTRNSIRGIPRDVVEKTADKISNIRKSKYSEYLMDNMGEIQRKSRGRRIVDGINSWFFDNMINSLTTVVQTSSVAFDASLNALSNYSHALLLGVQGKGLDSVAKFSRANTYSVYLAKEIKTGLKLAYKEFMSPQGTGDVIVNSQSQIPTYLKNHVLANSRPIGQRAAQEADGIRGILSQARPYTMGLGRKLLASSDALTNHVGYRAEVAASYAEQGSRLGLKGAQLDEYIQQGLKNPTEEIHDRGLLAGAKFAYRADLEIGWMGTIEEGLNRHPVAKLFMPFYRTYGNTVERTLEYFPGLAFSLRSSRESLEQSASKQLVGLGVLSYLASEFYEGNITFPDASGGRLRNKNFIEADEEGKPVGAMPLSVKTSKGYTQLPIGGAMEKFVKAAGYLALGAKYMKQDELDASMFASTYALADILAINEQYRAVNGVIELFDDLAKNDPEAMKKFSSRFATDLAVRAIPMYRLGQEFNRDRESVELANRTGGEGIDYFLDMMENRLKKVVPGMSEDVPPAFNALGEPVPAFRRGMMGAHSFMVTTSNKSSQVMDSLIQFAEYSKRYPNGEAKSVIIEPVPGILKIEDGLSVKLNARQIAKYSSFFGGVDPASGQIVASTGVTLRDALDAQIREIRKTYKDIDKKTISVEEFNTEIVGPLNAIVAEYRAEATALMKEDPSVIEAVNKLREIKSRPASQPALKLIGNILGEP